MEVSRTRLSPLSSHQLGPAHKLTRIEILEKIEPTVNIFVLFGAKEAKRITVSYSSSRRDLFFQILEIDPFQYDIQRHACLIRPYLRIFFFIFLLTFWQR